MTEPSGGVVEDLGCRKRLVTALVGEDPETSTKETLDNGVKEPQYSSGWDTWDVLWSDEFVEQVESSCKTDNISANISQPSQSGPLEAVLGNGISNIIDSIIGDLELVAEGIDEVSKAIILGVIQR